MLRELSEEFLNWNRIFKEITKHILSKNQKLILIFDEVQWMAKAGSGFIGSLKTAWVDWQKSNLIKVIICGSSNKFFDKHTGGEEKILRGLQTRPHIWVLPLSPAQVSKHVCPKWNLKEVSMLYMLTGGIPYYLKKIAPSLGFIQSINKAFFLQSNNLLDEILEIISAQ